MHHYTFNTSHSRVSPQSEVSEQALQMAAGLLAVGDHRLPKPLNGYRVVVPECPHGWYGTVFRDKTPLVSIAIAATDEEADFLWPEAEAAYLHLMDKPGFRSADFASPQRPESAPWIAAMTILAEPNEAAWVADLERCLAWAWVLRKQ